MKKFFWGVVTFAVLFPSDGASACSVCFGKTDATTIKALQMAVVTLLGCLGFVVACFLSIVFQIRRKNKLSHPTDLHLAHP